MALLSIACATADDDSLRVDSTLVQCDQACVPALFTIAGTSGPLATNRFLIPESDTRFFRLKLDSAAATLTIQSTTNLMTAWSDLFSQEWTNDIQPLNLDFHFIGGR